MASPVLKRVFLGADVRYSGDKSPCLILDGISRSTVLLFLKFIYTGESREYLCKFAPSFPLHIVSVDGLQQ